MPSVLVELGFLSNPAEEDFLQSEKGQDYMASAIYRAFKEYKAMLEGVDTTPVVQVPADEEPVVPVVIEGGVRFKVQVATSSARMDTRP